ncbi:sigma factor [Streptomyces coelicoflavus]|uniref:sigma factor n=1 Tax=Streptomyces coelicoflavus TaxID=285562 RepID=UPI0036B3EE62
MYQVPGEGDHRPPGGTESPDTDIFVAALQAAGQYDPRRGAPAAWLYGIARNILASTTAAASSNSTRSPG